METVIVPSTFNTPARVVWEERSKSRCVKKQVAALIVSHDGHVIGHGDNDVTIAPRQTCPREEGEGYEKCRSVCHQHLHAEEDAIEDVFANCLGAWLKGSSMYVAGHDHICPECLLAIKQVGIRRVYLVKEPA